MRNNNIRLPITIVRPFIRFPADVFGDGSCGVTQPVGWASARGRRTRGGGGGTLERGGAGGAVPRRGGRPLGPARPSDPAAGEGSRGGRGGRDDRVRGAVGREAAGPLQRRGSGRARRPATAQRDETDDPEAGTARQAAGPPGGAAARRRAVEQPQGRGVDGGGARAGRGGGPARLGGAAGGWVVGPGAAAGASGAGHGGRAGGIYVWSPPGHPARVAERVGKRPRADRPVQGRRPA